ncbi:hypothetical protein [Rhodococcus sp. HNM0569]|uniref:hypothetical protein n=1 Tax=Rhodococcus sp. HNM0569 TaxID=2716340 RepID=UPI00146B2097|nr:hypothetical protein [Rhodococcus sp. HNM0569]NLU81225.1 hypothetical protein [Rhodococcus sp. HNM0569]
MSSAADRAGDGGGRYHGPGGYGRGLRAPSRGGRVMWPCVATRVRTEDATDDDEQPLV